MTTDQILIYGGATSLIGLFLFQQILKMLEKVCHSLEGIVDSIKVIVFCIILGMIMWKAVEVYKISAEKTDKGYEYRLEK